MSIPEIIELRKNGFLEEAYANMCRLYSSDKGKEATCLMFQVASDILERRIESKQFSEGERILEALIRLVNREEAYVVDGCERLLPLVFRFSDAYASFPREKYSSFVNQFVSIEPCYPDHLALGKWGEQVATLYLQSKGFTPWDCDWKSGHRDIDIIGRDGTATVFVEVKTRKNNIFQEPEQAVNYTKLQHIRKSMNHYIKYYHLSCNIRFDIVTVIGNIGSFPAIKHIIDVPVLSPR